MPPLNNIKTANQMQNCLKLDTEKTGKTVKCHSSHLKLFFMITYEHTIGSVLLN